VQQIKSFAHSRSPSSQQVADSRRQVLDALTSSEEPLSPEKIANKTELKRNNVDQLLSRMVEAGEVVKVGRGKYVDSNRAEAFTAWQQSQRI
jgi:predicted transcriptional regulator of viral defense system